MGAEEGRPNQLLPITNVEEPEKALKIFDTYSNQPVRMEENGPWGELFTIVFPGKMAARCREHLHRETTVNPLEFSLGNAVLTLCHPADFVVGDNGLWIANEQQLLHLDFNLKTNLQFDLPMPAEISAMTCSETTIWIGTDGAGLVEFDKTSHQFRQWTQQTGLLMDTISALDLTGDQLWIGYGNDSGGGLGRLNLTSGQITSFTLSITNDPKVLRYTTGNIVREPSNQPTHRKVAAVAGGPDGDAWFVTDYFPIHHYQARNNTWEYNGPGYCNSLVANAKELYAAQTLYSAEPGTDLLGVSVLNFKDGTRRSLKNGAGLPPGHATTLTLDGDDLWVGGLGYIARIDPKRDRVLGFAYVPTGNVNHIQLGGGWVWVRSGCCVFRGPL